VAFGTPNLEWMKNVEVRLNALNVSSGCTEVLVFRGRLYNSNKKKPNPGFLILQFKDIKNEDLPHVNCAARFVRQHIDEAVFEEAAQAGAPLPPRPTYQLLFHATIEYKHAHLSLDQERMSCLEMECKQSPILRGLVFTRSKGQSPLCVLTMTNGRDKSDAALKVEVYPSQFKVTERYEDQDMAGCLIHKHTPVVAELSSIIERLSSTFSKKPSPSDASSAASTECHRAPAAVGRAFPFQAAASCDLFAEFDDCSDDDYGQAPDHDDGNFATICTKRFRGL